MMTDPEYTYCRASDIYVNPDIEGYLVEKKLVRNAKTWCSLQGATLYLQKSQGAVIQTIDMANEVQSVHKLPDASSQFEITCKKGKHTLICTSPANCTDWVTALQKAMTLKSNGIGRSMFHGFAQDVQDDDAYAMPSDDTDAQKKTSNALPEEPVYSDVDINPVGHPAPSDTGQNTVKDGQNRTSHRPPLPSMQTRLAKAQQQQEDYVEPSSSAACQLSESQEGVYADVSSVSPCKDVEYTDGYTSQNNENTQDQESEYGDGVSDLHPTGSSAETVTLRNRNSLASSNIPMITISENGIGEDEDEVDEAAAADAFAELEQALTSPDTPDLDLRCALREEDYLPVKELHMFLANNSQLLHGATHRRVLTHDSEDDPFASIKVFMQEMQL